MHGDFAPWNTRAREETLLVFDWESAEWEAPSSWDIFHFHVRTAIGLKKNGKVCIPANPDNRNASTYMLYLLNSVCEFVEEENQDAIVIYKNLLLSQLRNESTLPEMVYSHA